MLSGENGDDTLSGGSDIDAIRGGQGSDTILGETGGDYLYGEAGADKITGGIGNDVIYTGNDTGSPFDGAADTITFNATDGIDALYGFEAGPGGGDVMRLLGTGYTTFAQVMANTYDFAGYSVVVTNGANQIYVYGVQKAQYAAGDFAFA